MSKYQWIKSEFEIRDQLYNLWDNFPLYKFINGAQWIRKRELDIAECLANRETFIELTRCDWLLEQ